VQDDEHVLTVCRYAERNPLRAGLVRRAETWRWSSLWRRQHGAAESARLLRDGPMALPRNWTDWVNEAQSLAELAALQACATRGRP
jgi:putative transposase